MKPERLVSHAVRDTADVCAFFDRAAAGYRDSHGPADRSLHERLGILTRLLPQLRGGMLVEIGCGTAMHLFELAGRFDRAVGLDLSPAMIGRCEALRKVHPLAERIAFAVDPAERLETLQDETVDALICVGAFEHMLRKQQVAQQIRRVLRPGGTFVCLTPNGRYLWYTHLAPWLGLETRHLSTDRFLSEPEWRQLLAHAELRVEAVLPWTFIPRGDMPPFAARLLAGLDRAGRLARISRLRGGLALQASKPSR